MKYPIPPKPIHNPYFTGKRGKLRKGKLCEST